MQKTGKVFPESVSTWRKNKLVMKLLAIETSTAQASVALSYEGQIQSLEKFAQREHTQFLLPMVQTLLAEASLSVADLDGIVFGRGPGSFTGLRIACSLAKGLAFAQDLPLYPVSSLAAIAFKVFQERGSYPCFAEKEKSQDLAQRSIPLTSVLSLVDARMGELYWAYFRSPFSVEVEERVSKPADLISLLDAQAKPLRNFSQEGLEPGFCLAGLGYEDYLEQFNASFQVESLLHYKIYPHARTLLALVLSGVIAPCTAEAALPKYIRNKVV